MGFLGVFEIDRTATQPRTSLENVFLNLATLGAATAMQ
jgi:hypothetical protein